MCVCVCVCVCARVCVTTILRRELHSYGFEQGPYPDLLDSVPAVHMKDYEFIGYNGEYQILTKNFAPRSW